MWSNLQNVWIIDHLIFEHLLPCSLAKILTSKWCKPVFKDWSFVFMFIVNVEGLLEMAVVGTECLPKTKLFARELEFCFGEDDLFSCFRCIACKSSIQGRMIAKMRYIDVTHFVTNSNNNNSKKSGALFTWSSDFSHSKLPIICFALADVIHSILYVTLPRSHCLVFRTLTVRIKNVTSPIYEPA